jgi:hypothetical protein
VALGEEHVPEAEHPGLGLEVLDDGGVAGPSRVAFAGEGLNDGVGASSVSGSLRGSIVCGHSRDTFFLDKLGDNVEGVLGPLAQSVEHLSKVSWSWCGKDVIVSQWPGLELSW